MDTFIPFEKETRLLEFILSNKKVTPVALLFNSLQVGFKWETLWLELILPYSKGNPVVWILFLPFSVLTNLVGF
jgi:hypothetical protein